MKDEQKCKNTKTNTNFHLKPPGARGSKLWVEVRSVCHEAIVPTEWPLRPGSRGCFCVLMPPPPQPRLPSLCLEGQDNCLGAASRWSHPTWVEPNSLYPLPQTDAVWLFLLVCLRRDLGGSCQSLQTSRQASPPSPKATV